VSKELDQSDYQNKLNEIRGRLLGTPSTEELQALKLHLDALQTWARLSRLVASSEDQVQEHDLHDHENVHHDIF